MADWEAVVCAGNGRKARAVAGAANRAPVQQLLEAIPDQLVHQILQSTGALALWRM